ncbi:BnaA02g29630D [Brassica napus]|uniref:BnaA02g29630D protein n=1 Tax=Brassica napus TaxID=3708 RepID=A0A078I4E8_BRANA|nr:BnaA02g29630D [Brassica napus]
MVIEERDQEKR